MALFFKQNRIYLFIYLALLCIVSYILLTNGKVQIHRTSNVYVGNLYVDVFFKYITYLGDGLFAFFVGILLLFKNIRMSIYLILSYGGAAIVSSFLKHIVYPDIYRPHYVFGYFVRENFKKVDGVDYVGLHSFPSGHALSAFALFFCLLFITHNHFIKIVCLLLAVLAAYSRVYLSQHWLVDIYAGSIIGVLFSIVFYFVFYNTTKLQNLNINLGQLLSKKQNKRV